MALKTEFILLVVELLLWIPSISIISETVIVSLVPYFSKAFTNPSSIVTKYSDTTDLGVSSPNLFGLKEVALEFIKS